MITFVNITDTQWAFFTTDRGRYQWSRSRSGLGMVVAAKDFESFCDCVADAVEHGFPKKFAQPGVIKPPRCGGGRKSG